MDGVVPFDAPRARRTGDFFYDIKQGVDFVAHNLPRAHRVLVRLNPYPRPWRAITITTPDGASLAAWYGQGRPGGPAILFAPGTFQTKDDTPRKRRALDLWRRLGASVLILDLRGFGGSHAVSGTAGYHEARDLHLAAARLKHESGAQRVTLWGESLGGAVSLISASLPEAETLFDHVVAWSPYSELASASEVADPDSEIGRSILGRAYRWLLHHRIGKEFRDFPAYLAYCAKGLGMTPEELLAHGSPLDHIDKLRVPATVFHAEDDDVVPVQHAHRLAEAGVPRLSVYIVPRGGHLDFDRAAPLWYVATTHNLLERPEA